MSDGRRASGRSLIGALGLMLALPLAAQGQARLQTAPFQPPAVYREALAAVATCTQAPDAACVKRGLTSFTARLAAEIDALPSGRVGLGAWLRFAARLHRGSIPTVSAVQRIPLRLALETLYAHTGLILDDGARTRLDEQLARLSARESEEIAHLVSAFDLSLSLAARARGDSGIERWSGDLRRAYSLATQAMRAPLQASAEARALLDALARVDMETMIRAALVMADALVELDASLLQETLDLPLVFIGGEGDTVHTEDRLLLIDVSGNDTYLNNAGGGLIEPTPILWALGGSFAADLGRGDDVYDHELGAQGQAQGGVGILYDEGGSDRYHIGDAAGQGFGYAGLGALYDAGTGDDQYLTIFEEGELLPVATKGNGFAGIGLVVDEGGSDVFRQDGVDGIGFGAAGGLGMVASLGPGDDMVRSDGARSLTICGEPFSPSAIWAGAVQGHGEVYGVGLFFNEAGDDRYECNGLIRQGCQGASDETGLGMLWDRAGDDSYFIEAPLGCDVFHEPDCPVDLPTDNLPIEWPIIGPLGQGASYISGFPASARVASGSSTTRPATIATSPRSGRKATALPARWACSTTRAAARTSTTRARRSSASAPTANAGSTGSSGSASTSRAA